MKRFATALLTFGIMLMALHAARADTTCPPNPPPGGIVNGNLVVPLGTVCQLFGVTVTGNVQVQTNAHLNISDNATQGSTIDGNMRVGQGLFLTCSSPQASLRQSTATLWPINALQWNWYPPSLVVMSAFRTARGSLSATPRAKSPAISPATTILPNAMYWPAMNARRKTAA